MKTLLTLIPLALALTASAQTNITLNILVEEPTRTNTVSKPLTDLHSLGLTLAWQQHQIANGTNAPSFRIFVRQELTDRLESLKTEARNYQLQTNKIDKITTSIQANWDNASAADRKLLTDWLAKYPVP